MGLLIWFNCIVCTLKGGHIAEEPMWVEGRWEFMQCARCGTCYRLRRTA